ncbi:MAG TPA: hypothetical protein P5161_06175, partial [Eubacteriales bacterium]|nr:hypothetical protein [Eubacteriales bacterium]
VSRRRDAVAVSDAHLRAAVLLYRLLPCANCCAKLFSKIEEDFKSALKAYLGFVKEGGTKLFSRLITDAELNNPFKEGTLKSAAAEINDILLELESRL